MFTTLSLRDNNIINCSCNVSVNYRCIFYWMQLKISAIQIDHRIYTLILQQCPLLSLIRNAKYISNDSVSDLQ